MSALAVSFSQVTTLVLGVIWPLALVVALVVYRREFRELLGGLPGRVSRVSFAGTSVEFVTASEAPTDIVATVTELVDATSPSGITSSDAPSALQRAIDISGGDFVKIDLRGGRGWLTSRLYIFSVVFSETAGVKQLVFVHRSASGNENYLGMAEPLTIAHRLERRFPWLLYALQAATFAHPGSNPSQTVQLTRPFIDQSWAAQVAERYLTQPLIRNVPYSDAPNQALRQFTYTDGTDPTLLPPAPYAQGANAPPVALGHQIPAVTRIDPASGPTGGGTIVTITGSGFTGATAVRFGEASANFTYVKDTELQAVAPPGKDTTTVTVVTPAGSSTSTDDWVILRSAQSGLYAEHGAWIRDGEHLFSLVGDAVSRARVVQTAATKRSDLRQLILRQQHDFVAIVDEDNEFRRLIDRLALAERVAREGAEMAS